MLHYTFGDKIELLAIDFGTNFRNRLLATKISKSDADSFYSFCVDAANYIGESFIDAIFETGKIIEPFIILIWIALIELKKFYDINFCFE